MLHFNLPKGKAIPTVPASTGNAITKEYYDFLVGQINNGTMYKAVCRIEDKRFGKYGTSYHLISLP
jgi:hypothetical protein